MENILSKERGTVIRVEKGLGEEKKESHEQNMVVKGYWVWVEKLGRSM